MTIEVGQKVTGKVTGITHFGAFVELPENKTGLIHISEVASNYVKDIATVLTIGQEVEVKVLTIAADGKISLSLKQATEQATAPRPARPPREKRDFVPAKDDERDFVPRRPNKPAPKKEAGSTNNLFGNAQGKTNDFDQLMSSFLKDSEDRLSSLRRNTEGKRGGRGGRRS
ncbi:MAG: S1 domain-containing RNA-binding protein [Aerococcaceae bacterium]|nr:S1 domain-containing RNA-binding protein [Aerococcaceae bacterium]